MLTEEQITTEIKRLEDLKQNLIAQVNQVEGALQAYRLVIAPPAPQPDGGAS